MGGGKGTHVYEGKNLGGRFCCLLLGGNNGERGAGGVGGNLVCLGFLFILIRMIPGRDSIDHGR